MKKWKRGEFVFCFVVVWTAVLFQGHGLYQEWREEQKVVEAFKLLDVNEIKCMEYKTHLLLKGSRTGKMTLEEKAKKTDRLFHSLKAEVVESVREEDLYTVYGYSPLFHRSISYGENEINLNLAFSYDEEKGQTVFYLAVPFIEEDF